VAKGRDLATFREGLKVGQVLRGHVLEVFSGGRVLIHLRGENLVAETQGVKLGKGQTLSLSVHDLTERIELKWIESDRLLNWTQLTSNLTTARFLGAMHRLQELIFAAMPENIPGLRLKKKWEKIRRRALRTPIFLPKTATSNHATLITGEIITASGGYPSVMSIAKETADEETDERNQDSSFHTFRRSEKSWFEWCLVNESFGPIVFSIDRNNGKLQCSIHVTNETFEYFGKHRDLLISRMETLGYHPIEVSLKRLEDSPPDILKTLDCCFEESLNLTI
jgi:hypothetical protein